MKLLELWKKDRKSFWKELELSFAWLIGWPVRLSWPVAGCQKFRKGQRSLIGHSYLFIRPQGYKIRSPFEGKVEKIYPNDTIHLINKYGLQVIISLEFDRNNPLSMFDVVKCLVKENQKVNPNTSLFLVFFPSKIAKVTVFLPWQPWLIGKIRELPTFFGKDFASLYYRNPLSKDKWRVKRHREYQY